MNINSTQNVNSLLEREELNLFFLSLETLRQPIWSVYGLSPVVRFGKTQNTRSSLVMFLGRTPEAFGFYSRTLACVPKPRAFPNDGC